MALTNVENAVAIRYQGITIYHVHKNDKFEMGVLEYYFTLNAYGLEKSEDCFDVRELVGYSCQESFAWNLVQMIKAGIFGDISEDKNELPNALDHNHTKFGFCPVCNTEISDYEISRVMDEAVACPFTCENCGVSGSEWSKTIFDGYTVN